VQPGDHATGGYYIAADTMAFMQLLKAICQPLPHPCASSSRHGGRPVPYHWGRYRVWPTCSRSQIFVTHLMNNVFFDT